jgi:phosphoserine phosphatase
VVESLAAVLGMEGGIGTRYEVDAEGAFTGRLDGPFVYGPGKVTAMEAFAGAHDIDLAQSYAYSDSLSDLPMLRAVGNPVAVNPDPPLAAIAKEEDWQVLRFERLGRRLTAIAVTILATVAGFGASRVAANRRPAPRRFRPRR